MSTKQNTESIAQWKRRIEELEATIQPLLAERSKLEQQVLEAESEFKVGDVIEWESGVRQDRCPDKRGRVFKVCHWVDRSMWQVRRILKDGSEGKACSVYPYQEPRLVEGVSKGT